MSKVCAVFLFCLGLFCLAQAQVPMTGAGKGAPGGGAPACAGFTIDGAATSQPATGSTTSTQTITTTSSNEVIISLITSTADAVTNTTDNSGVTAAWTVNRATAGTGPGLFESWTTASAPITAKTITTTYTGSTAFVETIVFGVIGAKISAPFDTGGSSNVPQTSTGAAVSVITNNANTLVLGFSRNASNTNPTSGGFTAVGGATTFAGFTLAQYKAITAAGTTSVSDPSGTANGLIGDALVCGP